MMNSTLLFPLFKSISIYLCVYIYIYIERERERERERENILSVLLSGLRISMVLVKTYHSLHGLGVLSRETNRFEVSRPQAWIPWWPFSSCRTLRKSLKLFELYYLLVSPPIYFPEILTKHLPRAVFYMLRRSKWVN